MAQILDTLSALPEGLETNIGAAGGVVFLFGIFVCAGFCKFLRELGQRIV